MEFFRFFKRQILIGRVLEIPVLIDCRWTIFLAIMSLVTASGVQSLTDNLLTSLIFGLATTVILFISILLREFARAYAARRENIAISEIILYPFGGLARLRREPETLRAEFRLAVAGPAASFTIALFFLLVSGISKWLGTDILSSLAAGLCLLNFLLAVFNLFPGYPLDGGRVLRAYLWRRGADANEATVLTGRCGQIIAAVSIAVGIFIALVQADFFTGLWTTLIGLFLYDTARTIVREAGNLQRQTVENAMRLPVSVLPETDVMDFVDHILPLHRRTIFPVAENRQLYGMLLLEDLKKLPRERWQTTKVQQIMRPITTDHFIETDASMADANALMSENGINALGVIDAHGDLVGFLRGKKSNR
ncbi:MAG: site-2 protease family protein [Acidobacteriota bacterium]|nr:site-2 protease family protein [Acidobacteriota bacterium]